MMLELIASIITLAAFMTIHSIRVAHDHAREQGTRIGPNDFTHREERAVTLCLIAAYFNPAAASLREPGTSSIPFMDQMLPITMGLTALVLMASAVAITTGRIILESRGKN